VFTVIASSLSVSFFSVYRTTRLSLFIDFILVSLTIFFSAEFRPSWFDRATQVYFVIGPYLVFILSIITTTTL